MVLNSKLFKFTNVPPENEFDSKGNLGVYEYFDVHSKDYLTSVIKKTIPNVKIRFIRDTFFLSKNIMNNKENKLAGTEVVKSMQVADLLILPHYFFIIDKN